MDKNNTVLEYLKRLAELTLKNDDGVAFLKTYLDNLDVADNTVLYKYLNKINVQQVKEPDKSYIFPFERNLSQRKAVENAFKYDISIIEGPPGTGKTQTILNIIANALYNDANIAIVSQNNSATENIYEKLKEKNLDFLAAILGSRENKDKFWNSEHKIPDYILNQSISKQKLYDSNYNEDVIDIKLKAHNHMSMLISELNNFIIEKDHFCNSTPDLNEKHSSKRIKKLSSEALIKIINRLEYYSTEKSFMKIPAIFSLLIWNGIFNIKFHFVKTNTKRIHLIKQFYNNKISETKEKIKLLKSEHDLSSLDKIILEKANYSTKVLNQYLAYKKHKFFTEVEKEFVERKYPKNFLKRFPIILSTTFSIKKCLNWNFVYDYLIIDEASQVDLITGILAMSCAKKIIIVGDENQLEPIVPTDLKKADKKFINQYKIPEEYRYYENSVLTSVKKVFKNAPIVLLKEHYRCHPKIIEFCSRKFYNNGLIPKREYSLSDNPMAVFRTVPGNHARDNTNWREIESIKNEIIPNEIKFINAFNTLGIVTPYRNQADELAKTFKSNEYITADTVDKFQGKECDTIIISTVDNKITPFTNNNQRVNVAVSRAKNKLIVVTNGNKNSKKGNIYDLINYIEYNNYPVTESKICSIYDMLFSEQKKEEAHQRFKKKGIMDISQFDSERATYEVICEVLQKFPNLSVKNNVSLNRFIYITDMLSKEERKYALNPKTHTDFLIYNIYSKAPIMAIETDGYTYHKNRSMQAYRDKLKDSIFEKYGIKLLRLKTEKSYNEKDYITNEIEEILSGKQDILQTKR